MTHRSPLLSFHAVAMLGAALGACTFHPPAATDASDPPPAVDAPLEAIQRCTPGEKLCRGRDLEECNATGTDIDPTKTQSCGLGCVEDAHCVEASNIPRSTQTQCTASAPKLEPPAGATVTIEMSRITCSPTCGSSTSIDPVESYQQPDGPRLAVYCLSGVTIPADVTVGAAPGIQAAIAWLVAGNVQIDGAIDIGGGAGTATAAGAAGPAAGGGGTLASENQAGRSGGRGNCGGRGGGFADTSGFPSTAIGGGAGGGGHGGAGGAGGRGRESGSTSANGGNAGEVCGVDSLIPLAGGGGGGSGGDGTCGDQCGWPGGGGGGALQISATGTISLPVNGSIRASGGAGFGSDNTGFRRGGGGGGGAGGAVLLEALNLTLAGAIRVTGGAGGNSGAGAGGTGASGTMLSGGAGTNENGNEKGGAGGGGGAGRVRVNTVGASCPSSVEPTGACMPGGLRATPAP